MPLWQSTNQRGMLADDELFRTYYKTAIEDEKNEKLNIIKKVPKMVQTN